MRRLLFLRSIILLLVFVFMKKVTSIGKVQYHGYKVIMYTPVTEEHLEMLKELQSDNPGFMFFTQPGNVGTGVQILCPPHLEEVSLELANTMPARVMTHDMGAMIEEHEAKHAEIMALAGARTFETYWTFAEIKQFYTDIAAENPELVEMIKYGTSVEGRDLMAVKISNSIASDAAKPIIFMDATTHAREWITGATSLYFITQLLDSTTDTHKLLDIYDFVIVSCVNPDGYVYSWTTNRLWRKNRTKNQGSFCVGVDPNRNWFDGFGLSGASNKACDETYHGKTSLGPYSIPETRDLHKLMMSLTDNMLMYISLHSYSQLVLLSYGCSDLKEPNTNFELQKRFADRAVQEFNQRGTKYEAGKSDDILYSACGTSSDSVMNETIAPIAYTFELRDTGTFGFLLPQDQIKPCAQETTAAIGAMLKEVALTMLFTEIE